LLIVIDRAVLARFVRWLPKLRLLGLTPMIGVVPVPLSETLFGLPAASWTMLIPALFTPVLVGVNVTETVQFAPAASVAPQVVVRANWPASLPLRVIALAASPVNTRSAVPVLLMVIDCAALATFVRWLPNVRLAGLTPMMGAVPVPVSDTVLGLPAAL
jgi:hypothetical protein